MLLHMLLIDLPQKYWRQPASIKHFRQIFFFPSKKENLIPTCLTLCPLKTKGHFGIDFKGFAGSLATTNASGVKILEAQGTGEEAEQTGAWGLRAKALCCQGGK